MSDQHSSTHRVTRRGLLAAGALTAAVTSISTPAAAAPRSPGRPFRATSLFAESFDGIVPATGFTHDAPRGWTNEAWGFDTGEGRWAGWTFCGVRDWTWAAGTDGRHYFTGGFGTFAVVESEHHRLRDGGDDTLSARLTTPRIPLRGHRRVELRFDSHYAQGRPEQSAAVCLSIDGGPRRDLLVLDEDRFSSHEALLVELDGRAGHVQFSFEYRSGHNDRWWAIDNVEVVVPLPELDDAAEPSAVIDVISDVHINDAENSQKYHRAIDQLNAMEPQASALVINGDGVELGLQAHYDQLAQDLEQNPHASGEVLYAVGNHEMLGDEGSEVYLARYLEVAGEQKPYFERVVDGVPLIVTGTEHYSDTDRRGREPYNNFSQAQLDWLDGRLRHWASRGTVALVFNHFPLPYTVSQTHSSWEQNNYEDIDAFNAAIGRHRNLILFMGHTHDDITMNDWWGTYRVADQRCPAGFPVVNTGALLNAYVPDGDMDTATLDGDHSSGLRVHVHQDRIRVEAYDFVARRVLKHQDFGTDELLR